MVALHNLRPLMNNSDSGTLLFTFGLDISLSHIGHRHVDGSSHVGGGVTIHGRYELDVLDAAVLAGRK